MPNKTATVEREKRKKQKHKKHWLMLVVSFILIGLLLFSKLRTLINEKMNKNKIIKNFQTKLIKFVLSVQLLNFCDHCQWPRLFSNLHYLYTQYKIPWNMDMDTHDTSIILYKLWPICRA